MQQPLQYFFALNYTENTNKTISTSTATSSKKEISYRLFPMARNKILIRFENLADPLDSSKNNTLNLNIQTFSKDLYSMQNQGLLPKSLSVEEVNVSAN